MKRKKITRVKKNKRFIIQKKLSKKEDIQRRLKDV